MRGFKWRGPTGEKTPVSDWLVWETEDKKYKIVRSVSTLGDGSYYAASFENVATIGTDLPDLRTALEVCVRHDLGCSLEDPGEWRNNEQVLSDARESGVDSLASPKGRNMNAVKAKTLEISCEHANALLRDGGMLKGPKDWARSKLAKHFEGLFLKIKEDDLEDPDCKELYSDVSETLARGGEVVIGGEEVKPGPDPAPAKKPEGPPEKRGRPKKEVSEEAPEKPAKKVKKEGKPNQGVCKTALHMLETRASEKKPMSLERLTELVEAKFPDHENKEGMKNTLKRTPYWSEYHYEVDFHKSAKGWWVTRDYEGEYRRVKRASKKEK